jgi:hypothetical protein
MGFKKPLFGSPQQFVIDCFLSYQPAAESLIHRVLLAGPSDEQGRYHCWHGSGSYIGWERVLALSDFRSEQNCNYLFIINIRPFFHRISDLLDPSKPPE